MKLYELSGLLCIPCGCVHISTEKPSKKISMTYWYASALCTIMSYYIILPKSGNQSWELANFGIPLYINRPGAQRVRGSSRKPKPCSCTWRNYKFIIGHEDRRHSGSESALYESCSNINAEWAGKKREMVQNACKANNYLNNRFVILLLSHKSFIFVEN